MQNQMFHGKGKYTYSNQAYYQGDWIKGREDGQGILTFLGSKYMYEGQWKDGLIHGQGKIIRMSDRKVLKQAEFKSLSPD